MLVTLKLPAELEHKLQRQAEAQQMPLDRFVAQLLIETLDYKPVMALITQLPASALPELLNFVEYLQLKTDDRFPLPPSSQPGSNFLLSIAGIGTSEEDDLSERDEEILAQEVDPIRGWGLKTDNRP